MKFKELQVGDTFDFINPDFRFNSFYQRCTKTGKHTYRSHMGVDYTIGSINASVYHVEVQQP